MFPFISTISGAFIVIFEQIWQLFSGASIVDLEQLVKILSGKYLFQQNFPKKISLPFIVAFEHVSTVSNVYFEHFCQSKESRHPSKLPDKRNETIQYNSVENDIWSTP